jgi:DNA adenine methylase
MSEAPTLAAIAPWFGGKRTLAPSIVEELGVHRSFYDVFCGGCSVLFGKPVSSMETCNDLHGDLVTTAMVLASRSWRALYERVDRMLLCQELIDSFVADMAETIVPPGDTRSVTEAHVERAAAVLAVAWIGRNGVAGTKRTNYAMAICWTQGGGSPGIRWRSAVDSVPSWHDRLKGVVILNRDGFEVLGSIQDEEGTAIYVDPPYFQNTRGGGGSSRYLHDFAENDGADGGHLFDVEDDHCRLARALQRFKKARVVVSYYDHPRLAALYRGWWCRKVYRQKNLHVQNRRGMGECEAPEVLLMNGPSRVGGSEMFA